MDKPEPRAQPRDEHCSTRDVARRLGLAVRSVQLMVDRGELQAWKTPGGHRRIVTASVDHWLARHLPAPAAAPRARPAPPVAARPRRARAPAGGPAPGIADAAAGPGAGGAAARAGGTVPRVLLIEDSRHFQNLIALLVRKRFPHVELHVADDGIAGLAMAGRLQPQVLLVDILLPGIDGAVLIQGVRTHAAFGGMRLIVVTALQGDELLPYAMALEGVPVLHKPRLVTDLPALLRAALESAS